MSADIKRTLEFLFRPGDTIELCAISPRVAASRLWQGRAYGKKPIIAGWFDDLARAAELAQALDEQAEPDGVYVCINPVLPALLGRANNRLIAGVDRTQDKEIVQRRHLLIDADPKRPKGISATDAEKAAAHEVILAVREWLYAIGWPEPLLGDSGNGYHLIYSVDMPNDEGSKETCSALLEVLAKQFGNDAVDIDGSVFNAARLTKIYGTHARKGDSTTDRPHRRSAILSLPEVVA